MMVLLLASLCQAQENVPASTAANQMPSMSDLMKLIDKTATTETEAKDWSTPVKLVIIFAGLAVLPSLLVMMTSFTRIIIVLGFIRRALTTQTIPPNIAIIGLALFLTLFTMAPTARIASNNIREFMLHQTRQADLALFVRISNIQPPQNITDIPLHIVVPAFIISEFRTAFEIGCLIFIPFLLLDMVIAGVLLSAGMMMLPPMMVSLPLKLILFILVDGWSLIAKSLSLSFH
jgi:flagellar biosynthetic protein FliP